MKKDILKNSLVKKKPVIEEQAAQEVVARIHEPQPQKVVEETTVKTSLDLPTSLYKAMKIKLIHEETLMKDYIIGLIRADLKL